MTKRYGFINPTRPPAANLWRLPCESPHMCPIYQSVDGPLNQLVGGVLAYSLLLHDNPIRWAELCKPEHRQLHTSGDINHRGQGKGWDSDWSVSQVLTRKLYTQAELKNQFQLPQIHLSLHYRCMYIVYHLDRTRTFKALSSGSNSHSVYHLHFSHPLIMQVAAKVLGLKTSYHKTPNVPHSSHLWYCQDAKIIVTFSSLLSLVLIHWNVTQRKWGTFLPVYNTNKPYIDR